MQLHQLKRIVANKKPKRVGRGGIRGKTSGRGTKGQRARAGHRIRPDIRERLKKLPKLRGRGTHTLKGIVERPSVVNISILERVFSSGDNITPAVLLERGVIKVRKGHMQKIKILGTGELTKAFSIKGCLISSSAREKIEKSGGSIV